MRLQNISNKNIERKHFISYLSFTNFFSFYLRKYIAQVSMKTYILQVNNLVLYVERVSEKEISPGNDRKRSMKCFFNGRQKFPWEYHDIIQKQNRKGKR